MEDLEKKIAELEAIILERNTKIADSDRKIKELAKIIDEKDAAVKTLTANLKTAANSLATVGGNLIPAPMEVDGVTVQFKLPCFRFGGNRYTAEDAATDNELVKKILTIPGQGILKIIE